MRIRLGRNSSDSTLLKHYWKREGHMQQSEYESLYLLLCPKKGLQSQRKNFHSDAKVVCVSPLIRDSTVFQIRPTRLSFFWTPYNCLTSIPYHSLVSILKEREHQELTSTDAFLLLIYFTPNKRRGALNEVSSILEILENLLSIHLYNLKHSYRLFFLVQISCFLMSNLAPPL